MPIMMGLPCSFLLNADRLIPQAVLSYLLIFLLPRPVVSLVFQNPVSTIVITAFAQVSRAGGLVSFTEKGYNMATTNGHPIYPHLQAIFPAILTGTMAGNMGALFRNGVSNHFEKGLPWAVENGLIFSTFHLLYTLDATGPAGAALRDFIQHKVPLSFYLVEKLGGNSSDKLFSTCFVSAGMAALGVLQLDMFYGASFRLSSFSSLLGGGEGGATEPKAKKAPAVKVEGEKQKDSKNKQPAAHAMQQQKNQKQAQMRADSPGRSTGQGGSPGKKNKNKKQS